MLRTAGYILCLSCFVGGPASGLLHTVHAALAGPHHHANQCPICIQLSLSIKAVSPDPPPTLTGQLVWLFDTSPRPQVLALPSTPAPRIPRAPPLR